MGVWAFFDFCLLAAGAVALSLSIVWRAPNLLVNMVFSEQDLTAGVVLGIALLITFALSIAAIVQRNHVTIGLVILNWVLIIDAIGVIVIGSFIWFYTLRERDNFRVVYSAQSRENKISIQDRWKCCGYFNETDLIEFGGSFCTGPDFVKTPDFLNRDNGTKWCVGPITAFADSSLNNVFTTVYGYMAILIGLFLASLCVINKRLEAERFKRIDLKRGGRGFV